MNRRLLLLRHRPQRLDDVVQPTIDLDEAKDDKDVEYHVDCAHHWFSTLSQEPKALTYRVAQPPRSHRRVTARAFQRDVDCLTSIDATGRFSLLDAYTRHAMPVKSTRFTQPFSPMQGSSQTTSLRVPTGFRNDSGRFAV